MEKVEKLTNGTTGGPVFVYVKDGKIIRITPMEFHESDAPSWVIEARGRKFSPPRKTTLSPYSFAWRSMIYSPKRLPQVKSSESSGNTALLQFFPLPPRTTSGGTWAIATARISDS